MGLGNVFPGSFSPDKFWSNIIAGKSQITSLDLRSKDIIFDEFLSTRSMPDHCYHDFAGSIRQYEFDPHKFDWKIDSGFLAECDSLFLWTLDAAAQAFSNCNSASIPPEKIACIFAAIALPTKTTSEIARLIYGPRIETLLFAEKAQSKVRDSVLLSQSISGRVTSMPAALCARALGIKGGSYTLDAACASSLYSVKLGCDLLLKKKMDLVLVGGVSKPDNLYTQIGFTQLRALSPSGRCAPFDIRADGLVVGEGAGVIALKRLEDAIHHGDLIYGVIRAVGLSNDTRGNLLAPDSSGQLRAMKQAYWEAGLSPVHIQYIECHGAGTPLGDATEAESLVRLWPKSGWIRGQCRIGSIKSMLGHLLTAAGAAGLIKTILAIRHGVLPPSLNFESYPANSPLVNSPFAVQTKAEPWPEVDLRRAAVSAFGFGGINAHLLLEQYSGRYQKHFPAPNAESTTGQSKLAIIGMGICLGHVDDVTTFAKSALVDKSLLSVQDSQRRKLLEKASGIKALEAIDTLEIEPASFRIPPNEIEDILPQQLLMLKASAKAMHDAGMSIGTTRNAMGTLIGIGFDFEATNFHLRWSLPQLVDQLTAKHGYALEPEAKAELVTKLRSILGRPLDATRTLGALGGIVASRIAREFKFGGPSFVISAEEASGLRALEIASAFIESEIVDTMLVGAVDLFCDQRNLASLDVRAPFCRSGNMNPLDADSDGAMPSDAAVALVVKSLDKALADGDRIYAVIHGIGAAGGTGIREATASAETYIRSLQLCFQNSGVKPASVGLIECHGSGRKKEDGVELEALHSFYSHNAPEKPIALASTKAVAGHAGVASGMLSVARTALALYHRIVPPLPRYTGPNGSLAGDNFFHVPRFASYWPRNRHDGPRLACVAAMTSDATCMHLVLGQAPAGETPPSPLLSVTAGEKDLPEPLLLVLKGNDRPDLQSKLSQIKSELSACREPREFARKLRKIATRRQSPSQIAMAMIFHGPGDFNSTIDQAFYALENSPGHEFDQEPGTFCFFHNQDLSGARLAFVYPGSGNHYLSMGRRLGLCWPEVMAELEGETDRFYDQLLPEIYVPWLYHWNDGWRSRATQRLSSDPLHMIFGQVVFGGLMTRLMQKIGISPEAVIPYSLGESAGLFALGAWPDRGEMLKRLSSSDLFTTQLYGPCRSVRQAWDIAPESPVNWCAAHVMRPASVVDKIIEPEPYVRRLIVNSPDECVIGGLEESVAKVVSELDCEAFYLEGVVAVHCDAARPVADAYRQLHLFPTRQVPGVDFYSCAWAKRYRLTGEKAAQSIVDQAIGGFDFTRTIEQAYDDGIRIFVEIGPGNSCSRMISRILAGRSHLAIAANRRNEDEYLCLLKCVGTLAAAGIDCNLEQLALRTTTGVSFRNAGKSPLISVKVGKLNFPADHPALLEKESVSSAQVTMGSVANHGDGLSTEMAEIEPDAIFAEDRPGLDEGHPTHNLLKDFSRSATATAEAHRRFLEFSDQLSRSIARAIQAGADAIPSSQEEKIPSTTVAFDRELCMEFAIGSVARVLGPEFAEVDTYPVRVRLPAEPLMLVDRILEVKGEKLSLSSGRVVTEHDVHPGAWYLDGGRAPVCISVEAGQADLFLCSYLGIDHQVRGKRSYRLLDARIRFHRGLPRPGETIRYHISIDKFVRQGQTWLFFFRFKGFIGSEPLITMTDGCAGFFTAEEVKASGGIILTEEEKRPRQGQAKGGFRPLVEMKPESYSDRQVDALRSGDLETCFGDLFKGIHLQNSLVLPSGKLKLVDRVLEIDPRGGRFGLGSITAEADIHPDDWFLTCHFPDDMVMPGTLMYECCAHTLRIFLLRMGWVVESQEVALEPVPEIQAVLKCRGPVTPETAKVHYRVEIKEIGYGPEPYALADAHMFADGHHIVYFENMSLRMTGCDRRKLESFWHDRSKTARTPRPISTGSPLFDHRHILEFATGSPSKAFGEPYRVFDSQRVIARLPGPPYCFIHRIVEAEPEPWDLKPGGWITAQYDMKPGDWYFIADRSGLMPYCVLLEIALQPCGWLAAYLGSALHAETDLKFRNLGGTARLHIPLEPSNRTLTMRSRLTRVNKAAEMIIEHFDFQVLADDTPVFIGNTYFGFFTAQALDNQVGLRGVQPQSFQPDPGRLKTARRFRLPWDPPRVPAEAHGLDLPPAWDLPAKALLMIDKIEAYVPDGGPSALGYLRGTKKIDPDEWFFKAHFYQDPVCPGSLGIESFIQLIKFWIKQNWPGLTRSHKPALVCGIEHSWSYRGQIIPRNKLVTIEAVITSIEEGDQPAVFADGWLQVDGRYIYEMKSFGIQMLRK